MTGNGHTNGINHNEDDFLVRVQASPSGPQCPFGNNPLQFDIRVASCTLLQGRSGIGKTTIASHLAGLLPTKTLQRLHIDATVTWNPSIPPLERCGVLFQQTTLLDELSVAGNIALALQACPKKSSISKDTDSEIKRLLESVGLDYARDAHKRPSQLSGGMGRRASLALQLAQRKRVIVLDEPFTGLDYEAAVSVAKELVHLRHIYQTALILISHEPNLAELVLDNTRLEKTTGQAKWKDKNQIIVFEEPSIPHEEDSKSFRQTPSVFGTKFRDRFYDKLQDYILWSFPLIALTFLACGLAISMLMADVLQRIDVTEPVLALVDKEVRPLIKMLTGEEPGSFTMMGVNFKVRSMLNATVPKAKATLYALGMAKLMVLEIGPPLTALLLSGRIGGSYAGKVATMQATFQNKLLQTLGINPQTWSLWPAITAATIAAPLLTLMGTAIALVLGGKVGPSYGIGDTAGYWEQVRETTFPTMRLRSVAPMWDDVRYNDEGTIASRPPTLSEIWASPLDFRTTWSDSNYDSCIEVVTYPPIYHVLKAVTFIWIIMGVAEVSARIRPNLTPRGVPLVITSAVVTAGLLVILADWGFSQLLLLRK